MNMESEKLVRSIADSVFNLIIITYPIIIAMLCSLDADSVTTQPVKLCICDLPNMTQEW